MVGVDEGPSMRGYEDVEQQNVVPEVKLTRFLFHRYHQRYTDTTNPTVENDGGSDKEQELTR